MKKTLLAITALAFASVMPIVPALAEETQADPMAATSSVEDAVTSPLAMVTILSGDLEESRRFYQGALGLTPTEINLVPEDATKLAEHWTMEAAGALRAIVFSNPEAPGSAKVRVVEVPQSFPSGRPELSSRFLGPLGFGLPMVPIEQREAIVQAMGFTSTAGIARMDFPRADGTTYNVGEIHFRAPDDVMVLGVDRGELTQIGPVDEALGVGGVAYSSFLVDDVETTAGFFTDVLGYERRREMSFRASGPGGGMLDMRAQEEVAFLQWFSPGASSGYLVMMELLDGGKRERPAAGYAARGIAGWTLMTDDLEEVAARWFTYSGEEAAIYEGSLPGVGKGRAIMVYSPDGIPVEIVEAE